MSDGRKFRTYTFFNVYNELDYCGISVPLGHCSTHIPIFLQKATFSLDLLQCHQLIFLFCIFSKFNIFFALGVYRKWTAIYASRNWEGLPLPCNYTFLGCVYQYCYISVTMHHSQKLLRIKVSNCTSDDNTTKNLIPLFFQCKVFSLRCFQQYRHYSHQCFEMANLQSIKAAV